MCANLLLRLARAISAREFPCYSLCSGISLFRSASLAKLLYEKRYVSAIVMDSMTRKLATPISLTTFLLFVPKQGLEKVGENTIYLIVECDRMLLLLTR